VSVGGWDVNSAGPQLTVGHQEHGPCFRQLEHS
jgi:hypothetical protein